MVTLARTGDRPLSFSGKKLASASSKWVKGQDSNRWHELELYETDGGAYVLSIEFCTQWQGELENNQVYVLDDIDQVATRLQAYDPIAFMAMGPDYPQFHEKQLKRAADVRRRYEAAVSELLADMPEEI